LQDLCCFSKNIGNRAVHGVMVLPLLTSQEEGLAPAVAVNRKALV
jgi:hypothetical protein